MPQRSRAYEDSRGVRLAEFLQRFDDLPEWSRSVDADAEQLSELAADQDYGDAVDVPDKNGT